MKKSILRALPAALALPAMAQSTVTLYGLVDLGVSRMDGGQSTLTFTPQAFIGRPKEWTLRSSTSSRLGLRGSEDLGGGLKAGFLLEHRLTPDTGGAESRDGSRASVAGVFWNAASWVGLSGGFGELRLGRQFVPAFNIATAHDPWGNDYNVAGASGFARGGNAATTAYNAVTWSPPVAGGFSAQLMVAAGEGDAAVVNPPVSGSPPAAQFKGRATGLSLQYRSGPLWTGFGWNDVQQIGTPRKNRYWTAGAAYDFGFVRPNIAIAEGQNNLADNAKTRTWLVGATLPAGPGRVKAVLANYDAARGQNFNANNAALPALTAGQDTRKLGLGYEYPLSRRTSLHADVGHARTDGVSSTTGFETGIRHTF